MQKRLYHIGWSDEKRCEGCGEDEGTEKHRLCHRPSWFGEMGATSKHVEGGLEMTQEHDVVSSRRKQLEEEPVVSRMVHGAGSCQSKAFGTMSEHRADGVLADGRWCSLMMTRSWGQCMGCVWIQS